MCWTSLAFGHNDGGCPCAMVAVLVRGSASYGGSLHVDSWRVFVPARVPHPGGYRVPELTEGDLNRPTDMKGMIQENRV
jgi:hypothetical protein